MARTLVAATAALVTAGSLAVTAAAAPDARLGGDFKLKGKILTSRNFDAKAGDSITRTYKFRPQCETGVCRVTFKRQRGDGRFVRSTMYRIDPGVYKATDKARVGCERDGRVVGYTTVTTRTKVTITRAVDGRATRVRADVLATAPKTRNCVSSRQTARLSGPRI